MREITVPEHLDVGEGYGKTSWNVRAIWENYAGWFHHRSTTELYDVPADRDRRRSRGGGRADALSWPPPGRVSTPANPSRRCTSPTSSWPPNPATRRAGGWRRRPPASLLDASSNFWERAWLRRSIEQLEARRDERGQLRLLRRRRPGHRWDQRDRPRDRHRVRRRRGRGHRHRHTDGSPGLRDRPRRVLVPPGRR